MPIKPFNATITPQPDSDGYTSGQRDRALVLNFVCRQTLEAEKFDRDAHPAWALSMDEFHAASDLLELDDLVYWRKTIFAEFLTATAKGLAAHAAAQSALADLDAKIAALPPAATGFAPRRDVTEV